MIFTIGYSLREKENSTMTNEESETRKCVRLFLSVCFHCLLSLVRSDACCFDAPVRVAGSMDCHL